MIWSETGQYLVTLCPQILEPCLELEPGQQLAGIWAGAGQFLPTDENVLEQRCRKLDLKVIRTRVGGKWPDIGLKLVRNWPLRAR